jgi:hypothetical protein
MIGSNYRQFSTVTNTQPADAPYAIDLESFDRYQSAEPNVGKV